MVQVTTTGLRPNGTIASAIPDVSWAIAGGTANAITATYSPANLGLSDGLILAFRATAANTTTTPTFAPDGFTPRTIVTCGGAALLPGDIPGQYAECIVRYNLANTRWELMNPARSLQQVVPWAVASGTDAITATYDPAIASLTDGLLLSFRAGGANATTTPTFSPNGLTARTIVRAGGVALTIGDIRASNQEVLVRYNLANTRWELLNPRYALSAAELAAFSFTGDGGLFRVNATDQTGGNVDTAQPWFPDAAGVAVEANVWYRFEGELHLSRAAGSTSHTTSVAFGGTATITTLRYQGYAREGDAIALADISGILIVDANPIAVKAASTSTSEQASIVVRGNVLFSAIGTFIPQFKYSAAPGGVPTILPGSSFFMTRLGSVSKGTWS